MCERFGINRTTDFSGFVVGVDSYPAEPLAKSRLHICSNGARQGTPFADGRDITFE